MTQTEPRTLHHPSKPRGKTLSWLGKVRDVLFGKRKQFDPIWSIFGILVLFILSMLLYILLNPSGFQDLFRNPANVTETATAPGIDPTELSSAAASQTPKTTEAAVSTPIATSTPRLGSRGTIAFTSERSGLPQVWTVDVATLETTQLTNVTEGACQADWSPDGTQIVYVSPCTRKRDQYPGSSLYIFDLDTRQVTALPPSLEGDFDPAWSPDGEWIAYTSLLNGTMQIMKIKVDDFETTFQLSDGAYDDQQPAWSPSGEQLAFVRNRSVGQIWLMDEDGENPVQFTLSGAIDNSDPSWYPQEDLILFSQVLGLGSPSKQIYGMRLEDMGTPEEYVILPGRISEYIPLMDHVEVSPDGDRLAFDYWYFNVLSDIYIMTFPGSNLTQLTMDSAMDYDPAWQPIR